MISAAGDTGSAGRRQAGRRPRDMRSFLYASDVVAAWVADTDGAVAGHVAVHRQSLPVVMAVAAGAPGLDTSQLAVVARLIVVTMVFADATSLQSYVFLGP